MPKAKKSRRNETSDDESQSEKNDKFIHDSESVSRGRKHKKIKNKASKHTSKKNRSTRDSSQDDSNSSGTTSTSASDSSESENERHHVSQRHEKRRSKKSQHKRQSDEHGRRHRKQSRERKDSSSGDGPNVSKWDSPERRTRHHSRSRSRQRHKHAKEHDKSEERDIEPTRGERHERGNRARNNYTDRNNWQDRRDNRDRHFDNRNRANERWNRDRGNDRYNERREHSRSPRQMGNQGNSESFKREPREHNRSPNRRANRLNRRGSRNDDRKNYEWGGKGSCDKQDAHETKGEPVEKEKPNFGLSGALLEDTNKVNGVIIKYSEPPEARKPKRRWRLYPFKGETALPTLHIHRQSCFLVGRDRKVADLAVDHPSCSKQHAALQYRLVSFDREDGTQGKRVRLYLIDLESANGTFLNNKKIEARKYYELIEKDVIKFGFSTREYVLLHENSKEDQEDDDVIIKPEAEDIPDGPNP
ncbi:uncharacterized protein [Eurosta solidaginis]|uniref:uncharacterized protein n=1 Tax=Eurosta solidaginis TaxID=178769 RepID=UPI003530A68F